MVKFISISISIFFISVLNLFAISDTVIVADIEQKLKSKDTDTLFYGFAANDIVIIDLSLNRGELKSFEILEIGGNTLYKSAESKSIENKTLQVQRKCVLALILTHKGLRGKTYHLHIKRIPESPITKYFNTNVKFLPVYDTIFEFSKEKRISRKDTVFEVIMDKTERVHSFTSMNFEPNRSLVEIQIPKGYDYWTCWISVGIEGRKAYKESAKNIGKTLASAAGFIPEYGPLIALGINGVIAITDQGIGDNIIYGMTNKKTDADKYFKFGDDITYFKSGNVLKDIFKISDESMLKNVYLCLKNDNIREGIDVDIKVVAFKIENVFENKIERKIKSISHKGTIPVNQ